MDFNADKYIRFFERVGIQDVGLVGGKNASLVEMTQSLKGAGIHVPDGFATTAAAYWKYLSANRLKDKIASWLSRLDERETSLELLRQERFAA